MCMRRVVCVETLHLADLGMLRARVDPCEADMFF